jgi:hypothetical protein
MRELQLVLFRVLEGGNALLWQIFLLESQTLNKISIAATHSLPISKAFGT